jgi:NAD(P)-dependent dehydrogenase (short-subunit alcohol dehydrogenase family)
MHLIPYGSTLSLPVRLIPNLLNRLTGNADRNAGLIAGVPLKRAGKPDEIAQAITYLASDKASFVTGQILGVNGGKTAS